MTAKPKPTKLLPCPMPSCGKPPAEVAPYETGMWHRVACSHSAENSYHEVVAWGRTRLSAAHRWNKMVTK